MKRIALGIVLIALSLLFVILSAPLFKDFIVISTTGKFITESEKAHYIAQRVLYIIVWVVSISYGVFLIIKNSVPKTLLKAIKIAFITIFLFWILLELRIYKCNYDRTESFWKSRSIHFH